MLFVVVIGFRIVFEPMNLDQVIFGACSLIRKEGISIISKN
jgi:hypothetical protein